MWNVSHHKKANECVKIQIKYSVQLDYNIRGFTPRVKVVSVAQKSVVHRAQFKLCLCWKSSLVADKRLEGEGGACTKVKQIQMEQIQIGEGRQSGKEATRFSHSTGIRDSSRLTVIMWCKRVGGELLFLCVSSIFVFERVFFLFFYIFVRVCFLVACFIDLKWESGLCILVS